jgi:quinol monooxygenase YgiN
MVHVVALLTAKPGMRDRLLEIFKANVPAVLAEEGCIAYEPVVDAAGFGGPQAEVGPDTFVVVERWSSRETLKAHAVAPHMKAYAERAKDLLAGRVIHILEAA